MRHRLLALVATSAIVAAPGRARADARECIAQSERAQQARTDGHLLAARDAFHACSNAECPSAIRADCEKSFDEVDRAIPSVVLIVRRAGKDLTDVRVLVDGAVVATKLDGRAISVDPGPHRVRVESNDGARLDEQDIVAHEAEKNRVIEFAVSPAPPVVEQPPAVPAEDVRHHTAGPWIVAGAGLAVAVAGVAVFVVGQNEIGAALAGCSKNVDGSYACNPIELTPDGQSRSSLDSSGKTLSVVGPILAGVGGAALIAGLIWHFLEPTRPKHVAFAPLAAPGLAGASVRFEL